MIGERNTLRPDVSEIGGVRELAMTWASAALCLSLSHCSRPAEFKV